MRSRTDLRLVDALPQVGLTRRALLARLRAMQAHDARWADGRLWSLVYHVDDAHADVLGEAYRLFIAGNAVSPRAFPSSAVLESDLVGIVRRLLHAPRGSGGALTSGGTESILMAVKAHRDWFRETHRRMRRLEIVLPASAHPAFVKAAQYLDLDAIVVPLDPDYRLDPGRVARAVTPRTVLIAASAPSFPYGMVDPIAALGRIARAHRVGLHVDASLGGMFLPFLAASGRRVPRFDFRVPGVTSISTDLHKFGFAPKGASVVLYRQAELFDRQRFRDTRWPGGPYATPALLGTRSAGVMAAAWASLMRLGRRGLCGLVDETMRLRDRVFEAIRAIDGLDIVGTPDMSVFAFTSTRGDIDAIAAALEGRGWHVDRQPSPPSIHMILTAHHRRAVELFLRDLRDVCADLPARRR